MFPFKLEQTVTSLFSRIFYVLTIKYFDHQTTEWINPFDFSALMGFPPAPPSGQTTFLAPPLA